MQSFEMMGLKMKNPVIVAAGPWSRGSENIKRALESGAGAVVTESIVSEPYPDLCPRFAYDGAGVQNIRIYSGLNMERWVEELSIIKAENQYGQEGRIIASIMAGTPSELGYLAKTFEKAGVDALELGLSCPMGEGEEVVTGNAEKTYQFTKEAVAAVGIPVIVKLSQGVSNLPEVVHAVERAGAAGISAIDTVRCILHIDTETGIPILPTYGGYSGPPIRPMGLAAVAGIAQSTTLPIIGIGGIENHDSLLQYIMAGATAGAIGTEILLNGYQAVTNTIHQLETWMNDKGITDLKAVRGKSLKELRSFEEIKTEPKVAHMKQACRTQNCEKCVRCCMEQAISVSKGEIVIDGSNCSGCGLCIDICPENNIEMEWR